MVYMPVSSEFFETFNGYNVPNQSKICVLSSLSWLLNFIFGKTLFARDAVGKRGGGGRVIKKGTRD